MYNSPYTAHMLTTVCFLLMILCTLSTLLRFWVRSHYKTTFGTEDWLVVPALVLEYAIVGVTLWGTFSHSLGYATPPSNVPGPMGFVYSISPEQIIFMMIQLIIHPLFIVSTCLIKLSILFFYKRLFCTKQSTSNFKSFINFLMMVIILWTIGHVFSVIFICGSSGVAANWGTVADINAKCPQADNLAFGASITSFIWKLQMRMRQKLSVIGIFMIGSLATGASMARMINWIILWKDHWSFPDGEYIATTAVTWTVVEAGVGLIAASLMTLSPLICQMSAGKIVQSIRSALSSSTSLHRSQGGSRSRKASEDGSVKPDPNKEVIVVQTDIETGWETPQGGNEAVTTSVAPAYMPR